MNLGERVPRWLRSILLWIIPLTFLGLFYFYPLGNILAVSFSRTAGGVIQAFRETLSSASIQNVIQFTFKQAALSTLVTLMVGLPGAFLFARYDFRGKNLIRALAGVPFVMPTLVVAAGFNALMGPNGWVNLALMKVFDLAAPPIQFEQTLTAIIVAHVFYNTTIVLRMVGDFWSRLNPRLEGAARVLGASRWRTLWQVTIPLLTPAVLAASLLVFLFDFTSFGVILVLGGPAFSTMEVEIYYQTISLFNLPAAATLSILQLLCTLALTVIYTRLTARLSRPLELRSKRYTQRRLRTWQAKLGTGVIMLVLFALLIAPLAALATHSVIRVTPEPDQVGRWTLAFYRALGRNPREALFYVPPTTALLISLGYAGITVILSLILGLPTALALARDQDSFLNMILDPLLMLPLGTSAVTLGLGFIVALDQPPLNLRTSPVLIPLAHTLVAFPFVVRSISPALRSINPAMRQAAAVLGAAPRQVFRHIDLPMVGRAVLVGAVFAFTISMGEFGATALISRPEYPTVPVVIYRLLSRPGALNYGQALALSTILMLTSLGGMLAIERFRVGEIGEF